MEGQGGSEAPVVKENGLQMLLARLVITRDQSPSVVMLQLLLALATRGPISLHMRGVKTVLEWHVGGRPEGIRHWRGTIRVCVKMTL